MQITEQQHNAANEIIELIAAELGKNRAVHPATAITSCARLSGSFMFRSFDLSVKDVAPGTVVLSEIANDKWPVLANILGGVLSNMGIDIDKSKLDKAPSEESKLDAVATLNLLQNKALAIMNNHNLTYEQMAYAGAMATAFIVKECRNDLAVESGFNTAIYGFIEGCKTYPPEFSDPAPKKKSFFKFWK